MTESKWHGDKQDGIELRYQGDDLYEVILYVGGRCVLHIEQNSNTNFFIELSAKNHTVVFDFGAVKKRAHVSLTLVESRKEPHD